MEEVIPHVVSSVDFRCYGAYADQPQQSPILQPARMTIYDNGEHLTDCNNLRDRGICEFRRGTLTEIVCPFIHDR